MPNLIKALAAARKALLDFAVSLLVVIGSTLLTGCLIYRIVLHPNMTAPDAVEALWPTLLAGALALGASWLIDRA